MGLFISLVTLQRPEVFIDQNCQELYNIAVLLEEEYRRVNIIIIM